MTAPGAWLRPLPQWLPALIGALQREPLIIRIALAEVRGSTPREAGVSMLVGHTVLEGTIGGGQLEWQALAAARALLEPDAPAARLQRVVLGPDAGQCCGGVVQVWIERFGADDLDWLRAAQASALHGCTLLLTTLTGRGLERRVIADESATTGPVIRVTRPTAGQVDLAERLDVDHPPLWLFGAGHVGQALARILAELPLRVTWIDSRRDIFPADVPAAVKVLRSPDPAGSAADAPPGCRFLVMTHSHALDFMLCRAILARNDFAWAGLIGSKSKAARFRSRLARAGIAAEGIARLVCPIGIGGIVSKWPTAIAVAVAAELLQDIGTEVAGTLAEPAVAQSCDTSTCAACDKQ